FMHSHPFSYDRAQSPIHTCALPPATRSLFLQFQPSPKNPQSTPPPQGNKQTPPASVMQRLPCGHCESLSQCSVQNPPGNCPEGVWQRKRHCAFDVQVAPSTASSLLSLQPLSASAKIAGSSRRSSLLII